MAVEIPDGCDAAAVGFDDVLPNDLVWSIVTSLDQHVRSDLLYEGGGRVFFKNEYPAYLWDCLKLGNSGREVVHGSVGALDPPHGGIAVQSDRQTIAQLACLLQDLEVSWVQQIEAAVCEDQRLLRVE